MKRSIRTVGALGVAGALLLSGIGATAASAADAGFAVDVYASDGSDQITAAGEFMFDSRKGDDAGSGYEIAYRGALDMTGIWQTYLTLREGGKIVVGGDAGWQAADFRGTWNASFTIDTGVVSVDESLLTCEAVQAEFIAQNEGTSAGDTLQCASVAYNAATGRLSIQIALLKPDGTPVKGADLDRAATEPPSVLIATPPGALFVKQSAFEAGKSFELANAQIDGEMRMNHLLGGLIPVSFDEVGGTAPLSMVPTFDSAFRFESLSAGDELPEGVLSQLPAGEFMLRNGAVIEPADPAESRVEVDENAAWEFRGWNPATVTVAGENVSFVGGWELVTEDGDDDNVYGVSYRFHAADAVGDGPLSDAVLDLLPTSDERFSPGDTVVPSAPAQVQVVETTEDVDANLRTTTTWDFLGWDNDSVEVTDSDVVFTGRWSKTVTEEQIVTPVVTFGVSYEFVGDDGVDGPLGDAVLDLLPTSDEKFSPGDTVVPAAPAQVQVVETTEDVDANLRTTTTWDFLGWDNDSVEVTDSDVVFTGRWSKTVTEEQIVVVVIDFGVNYEFRTAAGVDGPLPDAVLDLLPTSSERFVPGETIVASQPESDTVFETVEDKQANTRTVTTWAFQGWDGESKVVADSDITFVGLWDKTVTVTDLKKDPTGDGKKPEEKKPEDKKPESKKPEGPLSKTGDVGPGLFLAGGTLLLVAGSALVLRHIRRGARSSD